MIRPVIWFSAVCLAAVPVTSAAAQVGYGAMVGGSLANVSGDIDNTKQATTFLIGGFLNVEVAGFAVQPGLVFTRKGFEAPPEAGITPKATFDYLQIPVVFRIGMPVGTAGRFYIGAGPAVGFKLGCRLSASAGGINAATDCEDLDLGDNLSLGIKSTEFSAIAETGLEFGKFGIGIRADLGLSDIFQVSSGIVSVTPNVKTRTISAVAAIRF